MALYPKYDAAYPRVLLEDTDHPLPLQPNANLRYAYFKTIARGGTCIISSCKDLHLMRTICHKQLRSDLADDPFHQQRFVREARVTAMLQHPNTIPTYELGRSSDGHPYFTMKLVYGQTLREILESCARAKSHNIDGFSLAKLVNILSQVGHALLYAHRHGVVHRDIKPENILIGAFDEVLVLDWGLAKVWGKDEKDIPMIDSRVSRESTIGETELSLTDQGPLDATPAYMSPEQLLNRNEVDHRSDIYSLGAALYELLTLRRMTPGETVNHVLDFLRNGKIQAPSSRLGGVPVSKHLSDICMSCVSHDPGMRYQTMEHVIDHLEEWLVNPTYD